MAVEPRHRQQHLRSGPAAVGDSRDVRSRPAVGIGGSVWGSATGALFSWEPFDFGLRQAAVAGAEAAVARARAGEALTRLDVQTAVGAAFLTIVGRSASGGGAASRRRPPRSPVAGRPHARRQSAAARCGSLAERRRTRRRADAPDSGAAGRDAGADFARARAGRHERSGRDRRDDAAGSTSGRRCERRRHDDASARAGPSGRHRRRPRAGRGAVADGPPARLLPIERVRARQRRERQRHAGRQRLGPRSRPRELGGRRPGRLSQRSSISPACAPARPRRRRRLAPRRRCSTRRS